MPSTPDATQLSSQGPSGDQTAKPFSDQLGGMPAHVMYEPGYVKAVQEGTIDEWEQQRDARLRAEIAHERRMQSIADDVKGHLEAEARLREEYRQKREGK